MQRYWAAGLLLAALAAATGAVPTASSALRLGDCVIFREGGLGLILKSPTYWLRGSIAGISQQHRMAERCPDLGKPVSGYTHEDWETPWSVQHGTAGWLFRGQFLDQRLQKGELIDMDASWLERCEPRP